MKKEKKDPLNTVSIEDPYQIRNWCIMLDCREIDLLEAVSVVGNDVDRVKQYLSTPGSSNGQGLYPTTTD